MKDQIQEGDLVVVIFHDHGSRYLGKLFNDDWMRDRGFLKSEKLSALDLIEDHKYDKLITLSPEDLIGDAIDKMAQYDISQIPIAVNGDFTGSIDDGHLFSKLMKNPELRSEPVGTIMQDPFPFVEGSDSVEVVSSKISKENSAVLVKDHSDKVHIITKQDIISGLR